MTINVYIQRRRSDECYKRDVVILSAVGDGHVECSCIDIMNNQDV